MIAFWIAVIAGVAIGIVYVALGIQTFLRVRRDILTSDGDAGPDSAGELEGAATTFTWKAGAAVIASTSVIVLLGVDSVFWYLPAILAIGSAVAVTVAFLIDRRVAA
ncbi:MULTISPECIES: hypothetical protein [Mycolicibacterium]|jgi:hypothetical protein|uniref:Transmembrane protein n=3 Tax=Mycolicibacterium gilvum TaxID=1804 RepID=E6TNR9_MYCSR|nr:MULTISPECIES: hypothetical protein [Mycolicibacterium]ABP42743.1 hypothetical protein Mflv_0249 [Mycolicibacterium gilvum PYR-GCK]ADT97236.1 hypothetical protein Mspyr1_05270 [Mycolicibacterium gilvum Spyr1]MBV5245256.1 hypothetical protein [Mycolicibacterium sp. PAM1]MCV7055936.1 hypothetical protein [Mycolicibacterium gilvum]STZ41341.1 Uncharacterised protein [Mycolicibacterium gilvum]